MKPGSEDYLQVTVAVMLNKLLPKDAVWWHTPNGGNRNLNEARKLKQMGTLAGIPDIFILWRGQLYAIELKAGKNKLNDAQQRTIPKLEAAGIPTIYVCYSKEDVKAACSKLGIPLAERILSADEARELL